MKTKFLLFLVLLFPAIPQANAFLSLTAKAAIAIDKISKSAKTLSSDKIVKYSNLSNTTGGTKEIGGILGKLKLPEDALEDTYMRIAIHKNIISREHAETMFSRLSGTPGFSTTLRKIIGNSDAKKYGHLNELEIANEASKRGFKVEGIGITYKDPLKKGNTDLDIILQKEEKKFVIEAKDYAANTKIDMIKYRNDLDTLVMYRNESNNIITVFTFTNKPTSQSYLESLKKEAKKRKIELIIGSPKEQVIQINQLGKIL